MMYWLFVSLTACILYITTRGEIVQQPIEIVCPDNSNVFNPYDEIEQLAGEEPFRKRAGGYRNADVLSSIVDILKDNTNHYTNSYPLIDKRLGEIFNEDTDQISESELLGTSGFTQDLMHNSHDLDLPWTCRCKPRIYDLGLHVIPQYVSGIVCANKSCFYGHYRCLPIEREETVLVMHYGMCVDNRLPANLGDIYMLQNFSVQVGCRCGQP